MPDITLPFFNLLDEPWVPVIACGGERKRLGLLNVFRQADAVRDIEHSSPLVTVALHRVLLAILYRALAPKSVDDVAKWFDDGWPLERIIDYLEVWRERFYLFHEEYPFWQMVTIEASARKPWAVLAAEHNASNSEGAKILFDYPYQWRNANAPLDKIACWLLAAQTLAIPGGRGYSPALSSSALLTFSISGNLRETLLFNLPPQEAGAMAGDVPIWEREPETVRSLKLNPRRFPTGYANLYTWNSRSVHLYLEGDGTVSHVGFQPGIGIDKENDAVFNDPMVAYGGNGFPVLLNQRGLWRDFDSLLPYRGKNEKDKSRTPLVITHTESLCGILGRRPDKLSIMVCGQANDKSKIEFWRMERFILPSTIYDDSTNARMIVESCLTAMQKWERWLYNACVRFSMDVLRRNSEHQPTPADVKRFVGQMPCMAVYWNHLEHSFKRDLENGFKGSAEEAETMCLGEIRAAIALAWKAQVDAVGGGSAWTIRAMTNAGGSIGKALKELRGLLEKRRDTAGKESECRN